MQVVIMQMKKLKTRNVDEEPAMNNLLLASIECICGIIFMVGILIKAIWYVTHLLLTLLIVIVVILLYLIISFISIILGPLIMVCIGFGLWYLVTGETWLFTSEYIINFTVFITVVSLFRR